MDDWFKLILIFLTNKDLFFISLLPHVNHLDPGIAHGTLTHWWFLILYLIIFPSLLIFNPLNHHHQNDVCLIILVANEKKKNQSWNTHKQNKHLKKMMKSKEWIIVLRRIACVTLVRSASTCRQPTPATARPATPVTANTVPVRTCSTSAFHTTRGAVFLKYRNLRHLKALRANWYILPLWVGCWFYFYLKKIINNNTFNVC